MKRTLESLTLAVLVAVATIWLSRAWLTGPAEALAVQPSVGESGPTFPTPVSASQSTGELEALRSQVEALRSQLIEEAEGGSQAEPSQPIGPEELEQQIHWEDERQALIDIQFEAESTDPGWARESEEALRSAAAGLAPESELLEAECRATICRFMASHSNPMAFGRYQVLLVNNLGTQLQNAFIRRTDGPEGAIYSEGYMSRDGYELGAPASPPR